jgi:hypothetical protein
MSGSRRARHLVYHEMALCYSAIRMLVPIQNPLFNHVVFASLTTLGKVSFVVGWYLFSYIYVVVHIQLKTCEKDLVGRSSPWALRSLIRRERRCFTRVYDVPALQVQKYICRKRRSHPVFVSSWK